MSNPNLPQPKVKDGDVCHILTESGHIEMTYDFKTDMFYNDEYKNGICRSTVSYRVLTKTENYWLGFSKVENENVKIEHLSTSSQMQITVNEWEENQDKPSVHIDRVYYMDYEAFENLAKCILMVKKMGE